MTLTSALLLALGIVAVIYTVIFARALINVRRQSSTADAIEPTPAGTVTGFVTGGGSALGLTGGRLIVGVAGNFILGALMPLGIGLYAPCMILVSLLGLTPTAAFPIMTGSCAFLMPVASARFIRAGRFDPRI